MEKFETGTKTILPLDELAMNTDIPISFKMVAYFFIRDAEVNAGLPAVILQRGDIAADYHLQITHLTDRKLFGFKLKHIFTAYCNKFMSFLDADTNKVNIVFILV